MQSIYRFIFIAIVLLSFGSIHAAEGDTIKIQSHDETHWSWFGSYFDTVNFPEASEYRKIIMYYTLGCPSQGCSEWDYTTRIDISDPVNDSITNWIELVRIITPYAGDKTSDWKHTWAIDVTDYAELFTGERSIRAQYSGYQDGFTISIRFDFIEGTPPRNVLNFDQIYHGSFPYGYQNDPIENYLIPTDVDVDANAQTAMFRMVASGHGFNGSGPDPGNPDNCAEFCDKWFRLFVDGNQVSETTVWRDDCGSNILEDQTGTWIYNRAGWCPGDVATRYDIDFTPYLNSGSSQEINVDWEPYVYTSGSSFGISYFVASQVFVYADWNHTVDLSIERILQPSNFDRAMNINPICGDGLIEIKNVGKNPITNATIEYWVEGGIERKSVDWSGVLASNKSTMITLPMEDFKLYGGMTDQVFHAEIVKVNAGADDYDQNDHITSRFDLPDMLPNSIIIIANNNIAGGETSYRIEDMNGNVVFEKASMAPSENASDTVDLAPGCYTMFVEDLGCDGLNFFANNDGNGRIRIHPNENQIFPWLYEFESGFGCETQYSFSVDYALNTEEVSDTHEEMVLYPNPSDDVVNVSLNVKDIGGTLQVFDVSGRMILQQVVTNRNITFSGLDAGNYIVKYQSETTSLSQKLIVH